MARNELAPLMAQIALITGRATGDLTALRLGWIALVKGEALRCESCYVDVLKSNHTDECKIVAAYNEVCNGEKERG